MDLSDQTLSKSSVKNLGFKKLRSSSLITDKLFTDYEDIIDMVEEKKSTYAMRKTLSSDQIAYNASSAKIEDQIGSSEKITKSGRLCRTSSTTLEKDHDENELNMSKISFGIHHKSPVSKNDLFLMDILDMKKYALSNYIQENPKAADIRWSLFCAACHSYRFDSVLRPFPPMFIEGDFKNIDKLRSVAESCPGINVLYDQIQERNSNLISPDLVNLLYWVLIHIRDPQLKFIPQDKHETVLSKVMSSSRSVTPNHIFQVVYNKLSQTENFNNLAKKYKIIYGFHGSRLDNFYSILNFGLRISFNKLCAYGPGIYLSSELDVSLPYSPTGFSWGGSYFGDQISIVALCEMLDHPDVMYPSESRNKNRNMARNLRSLPEKYFIVQSNDLVRVKYLLIYQASSPQCNTSQICDIITWFQRHKLIAIMIAYIFLLLGIATSRNSSVHKFYKRFLRRLGLRN